MKNLKNFITTVGVSLFGTLTVSAAPPPPPPPPGNPPLVVPIGDNIQYIVIVTVFFGLLIIHRKLKKQNSLHK